MKRFKFSVVLALIVLALGSPRGAFAVTDDADNLIVGPGETYTLGGVHTYNVSVYIAATGFLNVAAYNGGANTGWLELHAPTITIDGVIVGNHYGYRTAEGPGPGSYPGGGGGYGGNGGASAWGNLGGVAYGTANGPDIQMGSGGANQTLGVGGYGGAQISLYAIALTISGSIASSGSQGSDVTEWGDGGGGGAGGGILIDANDVSISGSLNVAGGRGGNSVQRRGGGGGAGGRIKVFYHCYFSMNGTYTVTGGIGGIGGWPANGYPGGDGTYYTESNQAPIIESIADVGNDQGRQVRITWFKACADNGSWPQPVTRYAVWRRIDALPSALSAPKNNQPRLAYPPGDWDFVGEVPARGETRYFAVFPTLADSNDVGMHLTTFFVSGVTADPFTYYDSEPASGYSVDNLAPAAPLNLAVEEDLLTWDPAPEEDFQYYSVYGGPSTEFGEATLIQSVAENSYDISTGGYSYYFVTVTDFNGNEGKEAVSSYVTAVDDTPSLKLMLNAHPNPFNPQTTITYNVPVSGVVTLAVYDVSGKLVKTLIDNVQKEKGQYQLMYQHRGASGVYFVRLSSAEGIKTQKIVVLR